MGSGVGSTVVGDSDTLSLVELSSIAVVGSPIVSASLSSSLPPSEADESTSSTLTLLASDAALLSSRMDSASAREAAARSFAGVVSADAAKSSYPISKARGFVSSSPEGRHHQDQQHRSAPRRCLWQQARIPTRPLWHPCSWAICAAVSCREVDSSSFVERLIAFVPGTASNMMCLHALAGGGNGMTLDQIDSDLKK